jgi:hypothetical protein
MCVCVCIYAYIYIYIYTYIILVTDPLNLGQVLRMLWLTRPIAMLRCVCVVVVGRGHALYTHTRMWLVSCFSHTACAHMSAQRHERERERESKGESESESESEKETS